MRIRTRRAAAALTFAALLAGTTVACSGDGDDDAGRNGLPEGVETTEAAFEVHPGTREVTVTGAQPEQRLTLVDPDGEPLIVLGADEAGQAHFSYIGDEVLEVQTGAGAILPTGEGTVVAAGEGYTIRDEDAHPVEVSEPFSIWDRDDHPDAGFYDEQSEVLVPDGDDQELFGYITMRDGVELSAMVRLPGPASEGPYPTVVEYSGYGPSDPDDPEPGTMIAGLLGFATVGVNLRGTGCSGGVFDVFNTAQQSDGYDVIEAIARQPWVKNRKPGMIGLSYSGITQLYTAATQPPSLAAITPLSVIRDPWLQQWPGGVYNGGFTKQWLAERDRQASAGGTGWVEKRIEGGDETCAANQELREQNIDFEAFGRSLVNRPPVADERDLTELVRDIEVPVYLTGAWQDEQTGPQFADLLGNFDSAPLTRFTMFNGRHPDGYTPHLLGRWYEFLSFHVDGEVPKLPDTLRDLAPIAFGEFFGVDGLSFEEDRFPRFDADDFDEAYAAYEAEPVVRLLFDVGAAQDPPGSPVASAEAYFETWPPSGTESRTLSLAGDGGLVDGDAGDETVERFVADPDSAGLDFFGADDGYDLMAPTWDFAWEPFPDGASLSYVSEAFGETVVLGGPGRADLRLRLPDGGDGDVQVSLSRIADDGTEWLITTGLLRLSDRALPEGREDDLPILRDHRAEHAEEVPKEEWIDAAVALPSFAEVFRPGDRLAVTVSGPGRDFAAWTFETDDEAGSVRELALGGEHGSSLTVGVLPVADTPPPVEAACPSLRGQACRPYEPRAGAPAS